MTEPDHRSAEAPTVPPSPRATVIGVDLAAQPENTGLCQLGWADGIHVTDLRAGVDDHEIVAAVAGSEAAGIDCPLGWPDAFVATVSAHHHGQPTPSATAEELRLRHTDRWVRARTGLVPLSAATDKLGIVALRCARILERLPAERRARDGTGMLYETYPKALLAAAGLPTARYKRRTAPDHRDRRAEIVEWCASVVEMDEEHRGAAEENADLVDALLCAICAVLARSGRSPGPQGADPECIRREGWIFLPPDDLSVADLSALARSGPPGGGPRPS